MLNSGEILNTANQTIASESKAIKNLCHLLTDDFAAAVKLIYQSEGRVVITGIGKSAIIASKIVATLNSTGTPSIFMHAADAIHGDLGLILDDDIVICISKSGNTPEIKILIPFIKRTNNKIIAITGNKDSFLGKQANYILNAFVAQEACPNNLAPTTSTTAQMVLGDALAVCLLELRGFSSKDFAKYHPGGTLGKYLYMRVNDLSSQNQKPQVRLDASLKEVIVEITKNMLGVTAVVDDNKIAGIITDGDLRRMLNKIDNLSNVTAKDIMSKNPRCITQNTLAVDAKALMEKHKISQLLVVDEQRYTGVVHLHNLIKEGII